MRLDLQSVKQAIIPAEFYKFELPDMKTTTRSGWVDGGLCPFHSDRRAGSFRVNLETGGFVCFSCHAGGGDIIEFLRQRDNLTFRQAVNKLSAEWGVS